jgi:hypothetical protein
MHPAVTMADLKRVLTTNALTKPFLLPIEGRPNVYVVSDLESAGNRVFGTFDAATFEGDDDLVWLSYGQPVFDRLIWAGSSHSRDADDQPHR